MFIEHVNLVVKNLDNSLRFYGSAFPDWKVRGGGHDKWHGKARQWLHFGDEHQYLAFSDHGEGENRDLSGHTPGLAHFAFAVSNLEAVRQRLQAVGFEPSKLGSDTPFRSNLYFIDPDGFEVEFVQYHSDIVAQRNDYH
ncbi:VOC family protein [Planctobacterium marinum]|uniref:Glyoxalase n=1 Tax=Planctobacterium marinum TaxID=1631968 RepID=A0AA48HRU8_9ALTE|nr:glyoxalase [Planctobacterium marinum]